MFAMSCCLAELSELLGIYTEARHVAIKIYNVPVGLCLDLASLLWSSLCLASHPCAAAATAAAHHFELATHCSSLAGPCTHYISVFRAVHSIRCFHWLIAGFFGRMTAVLVQQGLHAHAKKAAKSLHNDALVALCKESGARGRDKMLNGQKILCAAENCPDTLWPCLPSYFFSFKLI